VSVSGADSNRVYAIVENENGGLFSSDDAGATWKLVNSGRNIRQRAFYYTHVTADPDRQGHGLRAQRRHVQIDRRRQDDEPVCRRGFARPLDRSTDNKRIMHASDSGGAVTYTGGNPWSGARLSDRAVLPRDHNGPAAV
jgi:hypothetical protein